MASINYTVTANINGGGATLWTGNIDFGISSPALSAITVSTSIPSSVTGGGTAFIPFVPTGVQNYSGGGINGSYFTIRGPGNPGGQYPTSGYSLDIWCESLTNEIASSFTWQQLINMGAYNLSSAKFTLTYDYTGRYAPFSTKGGSINFSTGG
jgi:hypothetical protein